MSNPDINFYHPSDYQENREKAPEEVSSAQVPVQEETAATSPTSQASEAEKIATEERKRYEYYLNRVASILEDHSASLIDRETAIKNLADIGEYILAFEVAKLVMSELAYRIESAKELGTHDLLHDISHYGFHMVSPLLSLRGHLDSESYEQFHVIEVSLFKLIAATYRYGGQYERASQVYKHAALIEEQEVMEQKSQNTPSDEQRTRQRPPEQVQEDEEAFVQSLMEWNKAMQDYPGGSAESIIHDLRNKLAAL